MAFELAFYALVAASLALPTSWRMPVVALVLAVCGWLGTVWHPPAGLWGVIINPIVGEFLVGIGCYLLWRRYRGTVPALACHALILLGAALLIRTGVMGYDFETPHMPVLRGETGLARLMTWALPWAMILLGMAWADGAGKMATDAAATSTVPSSPMARALRRVGDASYSLYLVHMVICTLAESWLPSGLVPPDVVIAGVVILSLLVGIKAHDRVELPLMALLKRYHPRHMRAGAAAAI